MNTTPTREDLNEAVTEFANDKLDDDSLSFTFAEAEALAFELGYSIATPVIRALKAVGLEMVERVPPKRVRTISCSSNDRWFGPGSIKSHGGSGWEQIAGSAGQEG
jgi:hypothetical protein